ncbi:Crp/Fnr family transcriptional regulator [Limimaricola sp.]|uniref:Crp/Fnr family transcriptional regulator n=1 Tax=Limimaricola sp. TaxID=2211665 RepID=UPI004058C0FA
MTYVTLSRQQTLERCGRPARHVYFLANGAASLIARQRNGLNIEAALVGYEGMVGLSQVFGTEISLSDTVMQSSGTGWRIGARDFRKAMDSPGFRSRMLIFADTVMSQSFATSLAASRGKLMTRLARWLLLFHDRVQGDELELTHDTMAVLLGVRRAGVTMTIHELEGRGLIRAHRGRVTIRDREGLAALAGAFYGQAEDRYERLLGPFRHRNGILY